MIDDKVLQNAIEEARLRLSVSVAVRDPLVVIEAKELLHLLHAAQRLRLLQSRERRSLLPTDGAAPDPTKVRHPKPSGLAGRP